MHTFIDFPNLGIHLANVGKSLTIHGFSIAYYGMVIGLGILCGIALATTIARKTGQKPDMYYDLAIYGVVAGIAGARIYYVIFSWEDYKDNLFSILNLRGGGLAIYGGVIGAVLTMVVYSRITHANLGLIADTVGPCLALGQMMGRWGNFFNREAFGEYTDGLFAMRLPVDAVRSWDITEKMQSHLQVIDGVDTIQVTPTFLFESMGCCLIVILLLLYTKHKAFHGEVFLLYLAGYGFLRFWIERLRTDSLMLPGGVIKVSQLLAAILFLGSLAVIAVVRLKKRTVLREGKN